MTICLARRVSHSVPVTLVCVLQAVTAFAQGSLENNLARTPPMGWNSWNCCGGSNEAQVRAITDTMVSSGMAAAGYQYVVIDDGWATTRDGSGNIGVNTTLFPSGIASLAAYIHGKGLKFGIYTSRGLTTCAGLPGSAGYETRDAQQYAAWGVDFVKADGCGSGQNPSSVIAAALLATGRPIVLSVNEWQYNPRVDTVANMWRIRNDIGPNWQSMIDMVDWDEPLYPVARPGHWNDADMLQVGNGGLTLEENRTHFAMWCMLAAPILAGNNLTTMSAAIRDILTQTELIAIDQDSLGYQARLVMQQDSSQVWVKVLSDSSRAVALLNRGAATTRIGFSLARVGWWAGMECPIRDLWRRAGVGTVSDSFSDTVPSRGTAVFRLAKGPDHQGPRIVHVFNDTTPGRVYVVFHEPLPSGSAQTASNYSLDNGASVSGAALLSNGRTVVLTATGLVASQTYTLSVTGLQDLAGNAATGVSASFTATTHTPRKLTGTLFGAGDPFSGNASVDYPAAVDGNLATFSDLTSHHPLSPLYVGYDMGVGHEVMLTGVAYAPRDGFYASRVVGMHVQGSDDRFTWTTLYTVAAPPPVGVLTRQAVSATRPYRYIRLEGTEGFLNVSEVEFYGYEVGTTTVSAGRSVVTPAAVARRAPVRVVLMGSARRGVPGCRYYDLRGTQLGSGRLSSNASGVVIQARYPR